MWSSVTPVGARLFKWYFDLEVRGDVPAGPMVVAPNHFSHLDPVIAGVVVRRPIRYLAVDELYGSSRFFDNLILYLGTVPLTRTGVPLSALRLSLQELATGGNVGVFPEGLRVWAWGDHQPKPGAAWLAQRSGAPLVPIAISGSDEAFGRGARSIERVPLRVEVLDPIRPEDHSPGRSGVHEMTARWEDEVGGALRRLR